MKRTTIKSVQTVILAVALLLTTLCGVMTGGSLPLAQAKTILGDIDGDGVITTSDARIYLQNITDKTPLTDAQKAVGDLNEDGAYSTSDVRIIVLWVAEGYQPPAQDTATRAIWIPYMEVEELLVSGDPTTARSAIDACLEDCATRGANTVYFHVRANSDAYYDSAVFDPNSKTSALLAKGFDPLACAIELAHEKGMELHAWVNPYRIGSNASRAKVDATFTYSNRYYYIPSDAAVQQLVVDGVKELVDNYDIDGVQFDDYFYPTGSVDSTAPASFEEADYAAYTQSGGTLSVADWRRAEVNKLIAACYSACHTRSGCIFGISPSYDFESNRDTMYADAATWAITPGYVDYLCPQLYVGFDHAYAPFEDILAQWDALPRHDGVELIAGLALYKTGLLDDTWAGTNGRTEWLENDDIMARQIACAAALGWDGIALYSHQSFEIGSGRDATVASADMTSACEAWLVFE